MPLAHGVKMIFWFIAAAGTCIKVQSAVMDAENADDFFDPVSRQLQTNPNSQFVYDVLPSIPDFMQSNFVFRFRVRSGGDTHVALSNRNRVDLYDIVFGSNKNRYVAVRRCSYPNCVEETAALMPDAVTFDQLQNLWIAFNFNDGLIQVGRGEDGVPHLEWRDDTPIRVQELGFSTWYGTQGDWRFPFQYLVEDCGSLLYKTDSTYSFRYTLPVVPESSSRSLEFKFEAEAANDVRIILASEVGLEDQDPAYEIVVGTSSNSQSEIRRCNNAVECCPALTTAATPQILSGFELRSFVIRYNNGLIKVFAGDDDSPFLVYRDPSPISVRAIGYSTGPQSGGTFNIPVQGITAGAMLFETQPNDPFHLDLPLVPDHKSTDIDITFLVQAEQAVLIALAPVVNMNNYDGPLFEIVLGGWSNTKSALRICHLCGSRIRADHIPLDGNELRPFRIRYQSGRLSVYEQLSDEPFLSYRSNEVLPIKAIGFTTTIRFTGRFVFHTCNLY